MDTCLNILYIRCTAFTDRTQNQNQVRAREPITIQLYKETDSILESSQVLYFAENAHLGVYACGVSHTEALDDFSMQVVHFFHHYRRLSADCLIGEALRLKRTYEDLFMDAG